MSTSAAAYARLHRFTSAHLPALFAMLPSLLKPSVSLADFVALLLGDGFRENTSARPLVAVVPRDEVGIYLGTNDTALLPEGRADALTLFVMNRGERCALPIPISGELRRLLAPGATASLA